MMERLNGEIRDREKVVRGLKKNGTPVLTGYRLSQLLVTTHEFRWENTFGSSRDPDRRR